MICPECLKECAVNDFIRGQDICYKCSYAKKVNKKVVCVKTTCKMCNNEIVKNDLIKKRQRTNYCSEVCALKGHKERNDNYWTRKLRENYPMRHQNYT